MINNNQSCYPVKHRHVANNIFLRRIHNAPVPQHADKYESNDAGLYAIATNNGYIKQSKQIS